jgi:hypothetical protein
MQLSTSLKSHHPCTASQLTGRISQSCYTLAEPSKPITNTTLSADCSRPCRTKHVTQLASHSLCVQARACALQPDLTTRCCAEHKSKALMCHHDAVVKPSCQPISHKTQQPHKKTVTTLPLSLKIEIHPAMQGMNIVLRKPKPHIV